MLCIQSLNHLRCFFVGDTPSDLVVDSSELSDPEEDFDINGVEPVERHIQHRYQACDQPRSDQVTVHNLILLIVGIHVRHQDRFASSPWSELLGTPPALQVIGVRDVVEFIPYGIWRAKNGYEIGRRVLSQSRGIYTHRLYRVETRSSPEAVYSPLSARRFRGRFDTGLTLASSVLTSTPRLTSWI